MYLDTNLPIASVKYNNVEMELTPPSLLPEDYTQLEYIESSGAQYINTAYKAVSESYRIKCKFAVTNASTNSVLFGGGASTDIISVLMTADSQLKFYVGSGSVSGALTPFTANTEYEMDCYANNGTLTVTLDGASRSGAYSGAVNKDYPLFVFASNSSGSASQFSSIKVYWFQIYDNGTLVRDFVPCMNDNGEAGLYDLVNEVFYGNAGSGQFKHPFYSDPTPELLWTNASPTSNFAAQTVSLNGADYGAYLIETKCSTTGTVYANNYAAFGEKTFICVPAGANITYAKGAREATASRTGVVFGAGYKDSTALAQYAIPIRIWGVKFTLV